MVRDSGKLLLRRGSSANWHLGIDLSAIGRDDLAAKTLGDSDGYISLAYRSRTRYDDKSIHPN